MSYILDALRRADAERERGAVPDLHAQPYPTAADGDTPRSSPPWLWIALALLLAVALVLAWRLFASGDAPHAAAASVPDASPAAGTATATAPPASAAVATETPSPAALPTQFPNQALSDITPAPAKEARPAARSDAKQAANPPRGSPPPAAPTAGAAPAAAEERIYALAELPDDVRRSLPALPLGGSTYSQNPASRMLIVNGQIFHEGDQITPELKLEQIRIKGAVLRFRNYRYAITF